MNPPDRILVAGIGNIFLGDDAFGVYVAQRLLHETFPAGVRVVDFGIRGIDLTYALMEGYDAAILIDAVPRGERPGTLYLIEPELPAEAAVRSDDVLLEGHSMDPVKVLRMVRSMGGAISRLLLVGCEPSPIDPDADIQTELSAPVAAAIEPAANMVRKLVEKLSNNPQALEAPYAQPPLGSPDPAVQASP